jgi:zinc transporter ZupT
MRVTDMFSIATEGGASATIGSVPRQGTVAFPTAALCVLIIFMSALLGALTPVTLAAAGPAGRRTRAKWFRVGNAFAAGFLASAALVHLLPDADRAFHVLFPDLVYPIASVFAVAGACAVLCLDIALRHRAIGVVQDAAPDASGMICYPHELHESREPQQHLQVRAQCRAVDRAQKQCLSDSPTVVFCANENESAPLLDRLVQVDRLVIGTAEPLVDASATCSPCVVNHHPTVLHIADDASGKIPSTVSNAIMAYILCVALSFHSLIEGLALGVSASARPQFVALFLAILAHKIFAAFALGVSLVSSQSPSDSRAERRRIIWAAVAFAGTTPAGALVGLTVSSILVPRSARITAAVMSSFSAGIFLFVAFGQLVADEFRCSCMESSDTFDDLILSTDEQADVRGIPRKDNSLLCAGVFVCSAVTMSVLALWV